MVYQFIGGLVLCIGVILIVDKLAKAIIDTLEIKVTKENEEEDWEGDIDKWKDYPYDELDSRDNE